MKHIIITIAAVVIMSLGGCKEDPKNDSQNVPSPAVVEKSTAADVESNDDNADAWLLVPGQSAGLTNLNSDSEEVYNRLGPPDAGDAAMMKSVAIWYTDHNPKSNALAIYTARSTEGEAPKALIKQIRVTSAKFKTKEFVGSSSTLDDIRKAFPTIKKFETFESDGKLYTVYDSATGIAFEVDSKQQCVAVIIHEIGENKAGSYLKFR